MTSQGIRIFDKKNGLGFVDFLNILKEIPNGNVFHWSILFMDVIGDLGEGKSIPEFEKKIFESKNGFFIDWENLNSLAKKCEQIIDISIIGCKDVNLLQRYENEQEMYETCDIVIEMINSVCWEIFSKDKELINRLAIKFKKIQFLEPNFME